MSNPATPTSSVPGARVLIVEDDAGVRSAVERGLRLHGFETDAAGDAEVALAMIRSSAPSVLVVDVGLPGMSGIELCRHLRGDDYEAPILILSARDQVGDRVAGLQAGADDYLVKPFALDELVARLQALVRRARVVGPVSGAVSVAGPVRVDSDRRIATVDGKRLELSRREFDLLATFCRNPEIVLSRIRLLELVWGYDFEVDTNVVDVFVGYLRRKLANAGARDLIATVRGVGFVLRVAS